MNKYSVGQVVRYTHHTFEGERIGKIIYVNVLDEDEVEYKVAGFIWLLWENEILGVVE